MRLFYISTLLTTLAACGGSGGSGVTSTNYDPFSGFVVTDFIASYDSTADEYTVERGSDTVVLPANVAFDIGTFDAASNSAGQGIFVSRTDGSLVELSVFSGLANPTSVHLERLVPTAIPDAGTATLTGDYIAILTDRSMNEVELILSGDASLTFDWAASTASGSISNRVVRDPNTNLVLVGISVADLILEETGTFSSNGTLGGSTTGGSLDFTTQVGAPTQTGSNLYNLVVAGDTANEAVGAVTVVHTAVGSGDIFDERGAFALGH